MPDFVLHAELAKAALEAGERLVLIQHTINDRRTPYRRQVSLWLISDKYGTSNLSDMVEWLGVKSTYRDTKRFCVTDVAAFMASLLKAMRESLGLKLPKSDDWVYYRWIAA